MKKFAKYALLTAGVALFIFLMLPFLEPPSLPQNAAEEGQKNSSPQIFTSNPLTSIVNRLARFFTGRSQNSATVRNGTLAQSGSNQAFANSTDNTLYAADHDLAPSQAAAVEPAPGQDPDEANAEFFMQNEDGEWVLVRQRTPETSHAGMHEISVKENAYDRYVKQERLARFSPSAAQREEVPESKLARLFNPIKRFLGFGDSAAASGSLQGNALASASARGLGKTDGFGNNARAKNPLQLAKAKSIQEEMQRFSSLQNGLGRSTQLSDLLNTSRTAREAAEMIANSMYPNPKTPQEQQARDQYANGKTDSYEKMRDDKMRQDLLARSDGKKPTDVIPEIFDCNQHSVEGMLEKPGSCRIDEEVSSKPESFKENNKKLFEEKTNSPFPDKTLLTPVLGVADKKSLEQINRFDEALKFNPDDYDLYSEQEQKENYEEYLQNKLTAKMYKWMLETSNCQSNNCYWVANNVQNGELHDGVKATPFGFRGDPDDVGAELQENFIKHVEKDLADRLIDEVQKSQAGKEGDTPKEMTAEERKKQKEEILKAAQQAAKDITWVLYNEEDMSNTLNKLFKEDGKESANLLYIGNAADNLSLKEKFGYDVKAFSGDQDHIFFSLQQEDSSVEARSKKMMEDFANYVNLNHEINELILQDAVPETIKNSFKSNQAGLQQELNSKIKLPAPSSATTKP